MTKVIVLALALLSGSAFAKTEPIVDTTTLTCDQAQEAVQRNGFQVYTTNGHPELPKYVVYWADKDTCGHVGYNRNAHGPFNAVFTAVKTLDAKGCYIGYVCVPR